MTTLRRWTIAMCAAGAVAAACGKGKSQQAAPAKALDAAIAAAVVDAAVVPPAPAIDAAAPVDTFTISEQGVGPIVGFQGVAGDDQGNVAALKALLAGTGLDVRFEVMDVADEEEEGYYSIRAGDEEVAQVMRTTPAMTVHVMSPRFATTDGVRVGDALPELAGKRNALACSVRPGEALGLITCRSPDQPDVVFVLDASCWKGTPPPDGKPADLLKLGACKIVEIVR